MYLTMEEEKKYPLQTIQDEETTTAFRELHTRLVNEVIAFCKEHNVDANEFWLHADCLDESAKVGSWQACTDSCFELYKYSYDQPRDLQRPLLFSA